MSEHKLQYYVLICNRKSKNKFIKLMASYGAQGIETIYGKGSAKSGALAQGLGLEVEEHKAILSALVVSEKAQELTEVLCREHEFHRANTGFAFSIAVDGLAF